MNRIKGKKPRLSPVLQAEQDHVERVLGSQVICGRCNATLDSYATLCNADLSDACPGFKAIEEARDNFREPRLTLPIPKNENYCGCCGRLITPDIANYDNGWCVPCQMHLGPPHLAPWDRAYSAVNGKPCPHEEAQK